MTTDKREQLKNDIISAFNAAKDKTVEEMNRPPEKKSDTDIKKIQDTVQNLLADILATAIETYIRKCEVIGVTTEGDLHIVTMGDATTQQGDVHFAANQTGHGRIE